MYLQDIIKTLDDFWIAQGCSILPPYDIEVADGRFYPDSLFRCLDAAPWKAAFLAPTRRPQDGRHGKNPYRFQFYQQYHVIVKPAPPQAQELYLQSLYHLGVNPLEHDIRFIENHWESPSFASWGLGWQVWMNGMEISQCTYLQQVAGVECNDVAMEYSYGLERLALYLQHEEHVYDLHQSSGLRVGSLRRDFEQQHCEHNFNGSNQRVQEQLFAIYEGEARRLLELDLLYPAY